MSPTEKKITNQLIDRLLREDFELAVHDGEEIALPRTRNKDAILGALCTTDWDSLIVYCSGAPKRVGSILLIWGNEEDLISDYTDTPVLNQILDNWVVS